MMSKVLLIILTFFFFINFENEKITDIAKDDFKVEISYNSLPYTKTINYRISPSQLILFNSIPDSRYGVAYLNEKRFKQIDVTELLKFLNNTNWESIPEKLVTPTIDGYDLSINIEIKEKKYSFEIDNTYHSTLDSLITLCMNAVPKKKFRKRFYIPYSEMKR